MKTNCSRLFFLSVLLVFLAGSASAVTLTVTPSATSNTNAGPITLDITGLTNGQQVTVQTYLDLNGNGVVDAGEPLMDTFEIKDGGASVIGGITNISVPFDSNTATGEITTSLSFAPPLENVVGQKIYRVASNPEGAFTPVTATLDVTNAPLGQSVSGIVYSNGSVPLSYAVVVALTATNQNYAGSTIADGTGHYYLTLNPGSYVLLPALPGYYTDQNLLPQVTLTNGMSATNDLSVTNGTVAISGQIFNAANSNTLGGVFLQLQSGSLFELAFTDTNGNYTAYGTSNNWKIKLPAERLARRAYLAPQNNALTANATLGNTTNNNIGLNQGNALFYGQLTLDGTPVPNILIECNDGNAILSGKGYTDANGNYAAVALVDTNVLGPNDFYWNCSPDTGDNSSTALADYIVNDGGSFVSTGSEAFLQNFSGLPITATISGQLVNSAGTPLAGISVGASADIGGQEYDSTGVDTDPNGVFSFGATDGQWYVNANCCGSDGLDDQGYYDPNNGNHIVNIPPDNAITLVVYPVGTPLLTQVEHISPTQFGFNLNGSAGNNYTVQATTNLASTNWSTLMIISNFSGNAEFIQDNSATNGQRFYRAFIGP